MNGEMITELFRHSADFRGKVKYVLFCSMVMVSIFAQELILTGCKKWRTGSTQENYDGCMKNWRILMYQLYLFPKPTIALAHGATLVAV